MLDWWVWPIVLFITTFLIGLVAVLGGVGGGVLFVPIVGGFFPFHLDFIRCTGLLVALCGSLSAGPRLLRKGLAGLRLSMTCASIGSISSIIGAMLGFLLPVNVMQVSLGILIFIVALIMFFSKNSEYPEIKGKDSFWTISGSYYEESQDKIVFWKTKRMGIGLLSFIFIGFTAGMFGMGTGWANVPVLNLLMGLPLKFTVATSKFLLSIVDTSAAWVYINKGALLPMVVVPSILGIMLGTKLGTRMLVRTHPAKIKIIVIALLFFAGIRILLKGLSVWK